MRPLLDSGGGKGLDVTQCFKITLDRLEAMSIESRKKFGLHFYTRVTHVTFQLVWMKVRNVHLQDFSYES